jgi:nucleotide-binding universal stress UspA family protein
MKILLGIDGSDISIVAARSVAERPWPEGVQIRVIGVVEDVIPAIDPWYAGGMAVERMRAEAEQMVTDGVQSVECLLQKFGLNMESSTITGHPKAVLVEEAERYGADLVVVGSHGRRGFARVLLGSVSEAVAMHAHCSVEVIREQRELY